MATEAKTVKATIPKTVKATEPKTVEDVDRLIREAAASAGVDVSGTRHVHQCTVVFDNKKAADEFEEMIHTWHAKNTAKACCYFGCDVPTILCVVTPVRELGKLLANRRCQDDE